MASLYKRGGWYWIAYYLNGRHVQEPLHTRNERLARDAQKRIEYEVAMGDLQLASQLPVRMIVERFAEHMRATRTFKSCKNDLSRLRGFFGPICEALKPGLPGGAVRTMATQASPDKYSHAHVKVQYLEDISIEVMNQFIAARIREDGWAPKTANSLRQILHRLFAYATRHHGFRSRDRRYPNPADGVDRQREAAPQIRFLTLDQIEEQLAALQAHTVIHAMVAVYIYAGLRREEALWLTLGDVDLSKRLIHVRAKTVDGEFWQPKTKRNRVVPISEKLLNLLSQYRPPRTEQWFFPSPTGRRWHPDNFSQNLREINEAADLPWGCLDFRHTFGSQLAQKGESLYKIATLMGNSPEICRRHYAALIPEAMHDSVEFPTEGERDKPAQPTELAADATQLLQELLTELRSEKKDTRERPRFRIARE